MSADMINVTIGTNLSYLTQIATSHSASHSTYVFLLAPIMFGSFFGNALVILAFRKGPRTLRTLTNYFVVNLAVSDMLIGCVSLPIWITINLDFSPETKKKLGDYYTSVDILLSVTSIYSLVVISLERLYAVKYPASHRYLKQKTVMTAIACIWSSAILITIIATALTIKDPVLNTHTGWITPLVTVTFALPLIIITASYLILFTAASQLMKADNQLTSVTREIRIAKTVFVIVSLFVVCWTPFIVLNLLFSYKIIKEDSKYFKEALQVTKALQFSNSIMNFFVYAVCSPDFKETFLQILRVGVREVTTRANTAMSFRYRNSMICAHLAALKSSSSTGGVPVMLQLDDLDTEGIRKMQFGIGISTGASRNLSSRLLDPTLATHEL